MLGWGPQVFGSPLEKNKQLTELTRQITPPTKNCHAPLSIESRKSSQSVNPYYAIGIIFKELSERVKFFLHLPRGYIHIAPIITIAIN